MVFSNSRSISRDIVKMSPLWLVLCTMLFSVAVPVVQAEADSSLSAKLNLSMGLDFSSGDYGLPEDTEMLYLPVTLSYETLPWLFSITASYLSIDGPGGIIGGGDGGVVVPPGPGYESGEGNDGSGGQDGEGCIPEQGKGGPVDPGDCSNINTVSEHGLGDVILRATYALDTLMDTSTLIDLTAKVKLATADADSELGTGENDYWLQLDVARAFGKFMPYGSVGYKIMGDTDEFDLDDIWFASAGIDYRINTALTLGAVVDLRQATSSSTEGMREWMTYVNWKPSTSWSINGYGVAGFSEGSPDAAVGFLVTHRY